MRPLAFRRFMIPPPYQRTEIKTGTTLSRAFGAMQIPTWPLANASPAAAGSAAQ
jgi:hypothetical protein